MLTLAVGTSSSNSRLTSQFVAVKDFVGEDHQRCGAFRVDGGRIHWRSKVGHVLNLEEQADSSIEKD